MKRKLKTLSFILILFTFNTTGQMSTNTVLGKKFPTLTTPSLAGNTVSLPKDVEGQIAMITVAFIQDAQQIVDSWATPYLEKYANQDGFTYHEIPMINSMNKISQWFINNGMRFGIDKNMHSQVLTYYGDFSNYQEALDMQDKTSAYIFLLDKEGSIQFRKKGFMNVKDWQELEKLVDRLGVR